MVARARGDVEVPRSGRPAVNDVLDQRVLAGMQHVVVDQTEHLEDRNQPDHVRAQDEEEEREHERRPRPDVLRADVGLHDRVPDELDDELQRVHEAGRHESVLPQVAPYRGRDQQEDRGRHQEQHEHVLRHREVDAEERGEMQDRVLERAVRDVLDDHLAGIESFRGVLAGVFRRFGVPGGWFRRFGVVGLLHVACASVEVRSVRRPVNRQAGVAVAPLRRGAEPRTRWQRRR